MGGNVVGRAQAAAANQIRPNIQAILGAQGRSDSQSAQAQANARGFALALARLLGRIGPQVQSTYGHAASATASFAKGFSDAEQHQANTENASLSSFLQRAGVPQDAANQALAHTQGTADVLYGTKGYGPASALQHEGAAFTAAADQLPQEAVAMGGQSTRALAADQANQDFKYQQMVASERAKIPAVAQSILSSMGLTVFGTPKPGYKIDGRGNVVRASAKSSETLVQQFASDQPKLNSAAAKLVKTYTVNGQTKVLTALSPSWQDASKKLFGDYKYLLKSLPSGQQAKAKRVLNGMIRDALISAGLTPPPKKVKPAIPQSPYLPSPFSVN